MEAAHIHTANLAQLTPQPDFPAEDLRLDNAIMLRFMVRHSPGVFSQSKFLQEHQRALHAITTLSLQKNDYNIETTPETYEGFTLGFSAMDAMTMILNNGNAKLRLSILQFEKLLPKDPFPEVSHKSIAKQLLGEQGKQWHEDELEAALDLETHSPHALMDELKQQQLAKRHKSWPDEKPYVFRVVFSLAEARRRRLRHTSAALLGAQVAAEFQDSTIAA